MSAESKFRIQPSDSTANSKHVPDPAVDGMGKPLGIAFGVTEKRELDIAMKNLEVFRKETTYRPFKGSGSFAKKKKKKEKPAHLQQSSFPLY